jgi:heptosyltransferase-2
VVLAPNWLGDIVMALPALADVRRQWAEAELTVAVRQPFVPLFDAVPGVNATIPLGGGGLRSLKTLTKDVDRLRDGRFDAALLLPNSFHAAWLVWRAGIPERWGASADLRRPLLTRAVRRPTGKRLHQAEYYQHLAQDLGAPSGPSRPSVTAGEAALATATAILQQHGWRGERLVGLAPGAAYGWAKRWPPAYVAALAHYVMQDLEARPVLVGAPADRPTAREVLLELRRRGRSPSTGVIDLVGMTDLTALIGVLARCSAFVANDSGAMHLAAALGVPVTAIFGPTREWATAPLPSPAGPEPRIVKTDVWCRPCMLRNCPIDHRCMTRISPEDVLAPLAAQLGSSPQTRPA